MAAGITRNALSTLERQQFPDPALRTLLGLLRAYRLGSIEELLGGEGMPSRELADAVLGTQQPSRPQRMGA